MCLAENFKKTTSKALCRVLCNLTLHNYVIKSTWTLYNQIINVKLISIAGTGYRLLFGVENVIVNI